MSSDQRSLINKEDRWRQLFCEDPDSYEIKDMHLGLVNVFESRDSFRYEQETAEEKSVPKLLTKRRRANLESLCEDREYSVVEREEFMAAWKTFTQDIFEGLDWSNIFVAGGSILGNLMADSSGRQSFKGSDIDIFIYGITNDRDANEKLKHIYDIVTKNTKGSGDVIRSARAVTILGKYPFRHVQVITRLYRSPAEVLLGFDIDCCTVGFDGQDLWAMERCVRALNKCYNLVNQTRRSTTYESRLYKYSKRGFCVAVPTLDKNKIDPQLFADPYARRQGLARLLMYDHLTKTTGYQSRYSNLAWNVRRRLGRRLGPRGLNNLVDDFNEDKLEAFNILTNANPSDYSEIYLPWGPTWQPNELVKMAEATDKANIYGVMMKKTNTGEKKSYHRHMFVTGIEGVLTGNINAFWCQHCAEQKPVDASTNDFKFVNGPLQWIKDNPAYQDVDHGFRRSLMTGSFTLPEGDWEKDVYNNDPNTGKKEEHSCRVCSKTFASNNQLFRHLREEGHLGDETNVHSTTASIQTQPSLSFTVPAQQKAKPYIGVQPGVFSSSSISFPQSSQSYNNDSPTKQLASSSDYHASNTASIPKDSTPKSPAVSFSNPSVSFTASPVKYNAPTETFGGPTGNTGLNYSSSLAAFQHPSLLESTSRRAADAATSYAIPSNRNYGTRLERLPWEGKQVSSMTKSFLLVSLLFREGFIDSHQKEKLKDLVIGGSNVITAALEAFEINDDFDELADTMKRIGGKR
eukprot:TRINITY_DN2554_c0_g1_i1.p1 TRINITY_DN2554_c0_g1~~TRINITY_DN2554_c0_g1_i1.p1  ORF type:complete len:745 (+),score=183.66 TRINITY_DN2554_c0_g1_i1:494-2728(+)